MLNRKRHTPNIQLGCQLVDSSVGQFSATLSGIGRSYLFGPAFIHSINALNKLLSEMAGY